MSILLKSPEYDIVSKKKEFSFLKKRKRKRKTKKEKKRIKNEKRKKEKIIKNSDLVDFFLRFFRFFMRCVSPSR